MSRQQNIGPLQRLRGGRPGPAALLVLCCYVLAGAAVPPGHMPAPLAGGTLFHLCPGDLRSAWLLQAFASASTPPRPAMPGHPGGHRHGALPSADGGPGDAALPEATAAEPDCALAAAGGAAALATPLSLPPADADAGTAPAVTPTLAVRLAWLRPPVRSPPS